MSYINRNRARQTGTNRTTQAEISNSLWISFAGRVTKPGNSSYQWLRNRGQVTCVFSKCYESAAGNESYLRSQKFL